MAPHLDWNIFDNDSRGIFQRVCGNVGDNSSAEETETKNMNRGSHQAINVLDIGESITCENSIGH